MGGNSLLDYYKEGCLGLPRGTDQFFVKLWPEGRLKYIGAKVKPDAIDELSARLICAALSNRERLLIVLPDRMPHRPALMFATGLIMHGLDLLKKSQVGGKVLYFGSTIGIRDHLGNVLIWRTALSTVFRQVRLSRSSSNPINSQNTKEGLPSEYLPEVVSVYSPADPVSILQCYNADWLAIDCGDEPVLRWIPALLESTSGLPVVAWCQNSLSDNIREFHRAGFKVFRWSSPPVLNMSLTEDKVSIEGITSKVIPLIMDGSLVQKVIVPLRSTYRLLASLSRDAHGRLYQDALRIGWNYFNAVESLPVPFEIYEAEVGNYWGLKGISSLKDAMYRFIEAIRPINPSLSSGLEETDANLEAATEIIRNFEPPLWTVLNELCVTDVPEGSLRVIVFSSEGRKQLFAFSQLARYNMTEQDLRDLNVLLCNVKELYRDLVQIDDDANVKENGAFKLSNFSLEIILVGLPSPYLSAWLEPVLQGRQIKVLIYPYQSSALARIVENWSSAKNIDPKGNMKILTDLGSRTVNSSVPTGPPCIKLETSQVFSTEPKENLSSSDDSVTPLWQPNDPVEEVSWLFMEEDRDGYNCDKIKENDSYQQRQDELSNDIGINKQPEWVENAIEVVFDSGWSGLFDVDATINLISPAGDKIEERYIRALKSRDQVLFIQGQRRQSLYSLIISRVHQHPSIELHLSLINRWHIDLVTAWVKRSDRNVDSVLREMRRGGSKIEASLTIWQWLRGETLSPQDPQDLKRIADVLQMDFVSQYYLRIDRAASRLRGLHRGLANRLNHWLRQRAAGLESSANDEVIDAELGLSLQDFRDSLLILRVQSISTKKGPFYRSRLGVLERGI